MNIKNETLAKLTAEEIGELGLLNCGVMTYKGQLKAKRNGYAVTNTKENGAEIRSFTSNTTPWRFDFIKIASNDFSDDNHYAMRIYDTFMGEYETQLMPLAGIDFLK